MTTAITQESSKAQVSSDEALRVARLDAEKAYRDLSPYRVTIVLETDGWHIDYELKNPNAQGGGPHYLIDATSGAILAKKYAQ
jgi:hypothetical protein